ncbi:hypothetical protein CJ255_16030 [Candidatus Viridilinea mediisalina]|uniref:Alpha-L-rhamnosidase six-hairpin glycosidase domain-containing protein n=1 Tax=Candidatus Viridilinea mediisalina TaxID=2024553 RepID=A0A2A6RGR7_9CHLR|nr:hypothetical protein CJ255_16030 [Candidatus Viridilinea mediisalina]
MLSLPASPQRASLALADGHDALAAPLQPLSITLRVPGYSGPATLHLYDARLQPTSSTDLTISEGRATSSIRPRGWLGPQWAILLIDGQVAGARQALFQLEAQTELQSGDAELDALYPRLRAFMDGAAVSYELRGQTLRGYRSPDNPLIWLRDHVYQGRGFRYFEPDVTSALDAFRAAQLPDGSLPDVLDYPERFVTAFRKEVESDLEFLYVQGVYEAWQMTGDDEWLRSHLEPMRRALTYITSDPLRWDAERGLVRRPYTIDMWDFAYGPTTLSPEGDPAPRHWIDEDTIWGTFHGDNTGTAHALELLARAELRVGDPERAAAWREQGQAIMERLNRLSWNGHFFTHFIPEDSDFRPAGVDPLAQLSLSNAYALSRFGVDRNQGQRIVAEYFARRDFARAFAEWYSIDPPFPAGSFGMAGGKGENPGEYTNGGIMPLVGGELARGAFRHGAAAYGLDILRRYADLTRLTGSTYLWYHPDGRPGIQGPDTIGTDGWGAGAMIGALFEGAAGFEDNASRYSDLLLSPRWAADPTFHDVRAVARYAASEGYAAYHWQREASAITLDLTSSAASAYIRILLPPEVASQPLHVTLNGESIAARIESTNTTPYLAIPLAGGEANVRIEW